MKESHLKKVEISKNNEEYIQFIVLKKTVETISFNLRRGPERSLSVILGAEMHKQPKPFLKQRSNQEDVLNIIKQKNYTIPNSKQGITLEEH
ncbi:hypothetical protein CWI38_0317p0030 [Hamiltosporidium tvaerminnensis]|uniref:Uncharacterized protein n=1 Tax=Hamiltosporidium tvaerminnensis TaxID=1176355 RepID=A0A4V2JY09_9MICR|nr:hypothetical protein CWI38_0317p0030 [Hamiltosporidium tvaerminnensis]